LDSLIGSGCGKSAAAVSDRRQGLRLGGATPESVEGGRISAPLWEEVSAYLEWQKERFTEKENSCFIKFMRPVLRRTCLTDHTASAVLRRWISIKREKEKKIKMNKMKER
jgi:hypothetical protein